MAGLFSETLIPTNRCGIDDADIAHTLSAEGFDASEDGTGRGTPIVPILEAGARTGKSTDDPRAGIGIGDPGDPGDPMFTLQAGKQHAIAFTTEQTPKASRELAMTLTQGSPSGGGHPQCVAFSSKDHGADATEELSPTLRAMPHDGSHANGGGQMAVALNLRGREDGAQPEADPDNLASMRAASGGSSRSYVAFAQNQRDEVRTMDKAGALAAEPGMKQQTYISDQWAVRRLTPRECERLQGFPDDFTNITYRGKPAADGPRYKALGNSMAVPCVGWILHRIAELQDSERQAA